MVEWAIVFSNLSQTLLNIHACIILHLLCRPKSSLVLHYKLHLPHLKNSFFERELALLVMFQVFSSKGEGGREGRKEEKVLTRPRMKL